MTDELRVSLWNILYTNIMFDWSYQGNYTDFRNALWINFLKKELDIFNEFNFATQLALTKKTIKNFYFEAEWYEIYDFLEFVVNYYRDPDLNNQLNEVLERELSAYRLVNGIFTDITNHQEVEMLEAALEDNDFPNLKVHLQRALELLSDRKNPDYRNSIKESISAVESIAKEIAQEPKAELGKALSIIEKNGKLHRAMKSSFLSLYGYTSDADGIRHALMEEPNLTADDAKFFLLTCTSFINYLKAKM